jgi:hypothetical protein
MCERSQTTVPKFTHATALCVGATHLPVAVTWSDRRRWTLTMSRVWRASRKCLVAGFAGCVRHSTYQRTLTYVPMRTGNAATRRTYPQDLALSVLRRDRLNEYARPGRTSAAADLEDTDAGRSGRRARGSAVVPTSDRPRRRGILSAGSDALALGYELHGGPALTFDGKRAIAAQAVVCAGYKRSSMTVLHADR